MASDRAPARQVCLDCAQQAGFVPTPAAVWVPGVCARCETATRVASGNNYAFAPLRNVTVKEAT